MEFEYILVQKRLGLNESAPPKSAKIHLQSISVQQMTKGLKNLRAVEILPTAWEK